MLKKLRLKFILINMTIVTIMLGVIFGLLYYSTSRNLEHESLQMMESVSMNPMPHGRRNKYHDEIRLPYFSVMINRDGEAVKIDGDFFDMSDEEYIRELLQVTFDTHKEFGVLKEYNLRFSLRELPMGQYLVFADMTSEQSMLHNLIRTFSIVGSAAFLVFLGISILLARWAVKPVVRAWQQQKQFVADASHELKTPLTVIMTDAELLHASDCPETDRETLTGSILTMSSQMRGLVENLLDLARIDNGSVKEEIRTVSFSDIVSETTMTFEPVFFEKGLPLRYAVEPNVQISGIPSHLKQLTGILLDNAVKYSSPGGETTVKLSRNTHKHCLLEVSNQGEPISDEDLKNLFKRFYRVDKARTMNHSYGLGLSIAQSIAEEHYGKIWAVSKDGYNRFFAELPCQES